MGRHQRSPRALLLRGGNWFRPPRPLIVNVQIAKTTPPRAGKESDVGYTPCDEAPLVETTSALVESAMLVIDLLAQTDSGAAGIVRRLCDRLKKKEEREKKLKFELRKTKSIAAKTHAQLQRVGDLQGQCGRYWWRIRKCEEAQQTQEDGSTAVHLTRKWTNPLTP